MPGRFRGPPSLGDIVDGDHQLVRRSNLTLGDAYLARKDLAAGSEAPPDEPHSNIASLSVKLTPGIDGRSVWRTQTRGNEAFERGAYGVLFRAAEQALRRGIEEADSPIGPDDDDRIRHLDDRLESLLSQTLRFFE